MSGIFKSLSGNIIDANFRFNLPGKGCQSVGNFASGKAFHEISPDYTPWYGAMESQIQEAEREISSEAVTSLAPVPAVTTPKVATKRSDEGASMWPLWALLIGGIAITVGWNVLVASARPNARPNASRKGYFVVVKKKGRVITSAGPVSKARAKSSAQKFRREQMAMCGFTFSAASKKPRSGKHLKLRS